MSCLMVERTLNLQKSYNTNIFRVNAMMRSILTILMLRKMTLMEEALMKVENLTLARSPMGM
jgi:hypothetical protein